MQRNVSTLLNDTETTVPDPRFQVEINDTIVCFRIMSRNISGT
jgi:hypothetical protein